MSRRWRSAASSARSTATSARSASASARSARAVATRPAADAGPARRCDRSLRISSNCCCDSRLRSRSGPARCQSASATSRSPWAAASSDSRGLEPRAGGVQHGWRCVARPARCGPCRSMSASSAAAAAASSPGGRGPRGRRCAPARPRRTRSDSLTGTSMTQPDTWLDSSSMSDDDPGVEHVDVGEAVVQPPQRPQRTRDGDRQHQQVAGLTARRRRGAVGGCGLPDRSCSAKPHSPVRRHGSKKLW
jgi:hypothetical protein